MSQKPPFNPNLPQAGWYPDPEHPQMLRWWDGAQWTSHRQPGAESAAIPSQAAGGRPKRRGSHRVRNVFAVIGALIVGGIVISALAGGSKGTSSSPAGATAASSAPAPASPAAAAKPAKAHTVATFSGSGQQNTPRFTVTANWKLVYSFDCSAFGYSGNFQVYEDGGSDFNGVSVNDLAMSKSASTWAYGDAGTHYLEVNSECSWKMKVVDEP